MFDAEAHAIRSSLSARDDVVSFSVGMHSSDHS